MINFQQINENNVIFMGLMSGRSGEFKF